MTISVQPMLLPAGFERLEPFVDAWAVEGSDARKRRRIASTEPERLEFYDVMVEEVERALEYLDQYPIDALDAEQQRLMNMVLTLGHIALAVEKQGASEAYHALSHAHFTITRATEDARP
jgi:hypothetical protein